MNISEIKGERAIELLGDILDPAIEMLADEDVANAFKSGVALSGVKVMLKKHSKQVIQILAAVEGVDPDKYEVNLLTLPKKLLEIFNDPDIQTLFTSQGTNETEIRSSSASGSIEEASK